MAGFIKKKKYGFNCIFFVENNFGQQIPLKYRNVTKPYSLTNYVINAGYRVTALNVYNAVTKDFIKQFRNSRAVYEYFGK